MKKKSLSLLLVMVLTLSMVLTGCGSKKDEGEEASTETTNKTAKELLTAASEKYEDTSSIENVNFDMAVKLNLKDPETNIAINGNFGMDLFVGDKPQIKFELNLDKMKELGLANDIAMVAYADDSCIVFTLDGEKYYKMSYNVLISAGLITQDQVDEILAEFKDLSKAQDTAEQAITDEQQKQIDEITKSLKEWADDYKVDGTKDINGEKATVIKGEINKDNVKELMKIYSDVLSSGILGEALTAEAEDLASIEDAASEIPDGLSPINLEFYISEKSGDLVGCYVDMTEFIKSVAATDEEAKDLTVGDCTFTITMGVNNTAAIEIPDVQESSMEEISAAFEEFGSMFDQTDSEDLAE